MRKFWRNNGLTLTVFGLFLVVFAGQILVGRADYNEDRADHGQPPVSLAQYLTTGHFLEATAENFESEFLQMGMFVILTVFLFQKGSPESKDPDEPDHPLNTDPLRKRDDPRAPWPVRRGGWAYKLYAHSLSLAFLLLFLIAFVLHILGGTKNYNEERAELGKPPISAVAYAGSSRFWFESFQNWQSEFFAIGAMVVLSVYLREHGSAESKPVASPHDAHGEDEED